MRKQKIIRKIDLNVSSKEEKEILEKAIKILDKLGLTICSKRSFILDPDC